MVRFLLSIAVLAIGLAACGPAPPPPAAQAPPPDPTREAWFARDAAQLADLAASAAKADRAGRAADAAAAIEQAQPIQARLLAVPRPPLAVLEAASDLDHLYGQSLLRNRHYGWARLFFQKNQIRWKTVQPATPDSERRLKQARDAIEECDRRLAEESATPQRTTSKSRP
jgi:hypothetical protein